MAASPGTAYVKVKPVIMDVYTVDDVATILKVSTKTVLSLLQKGTLRGRKVGRSWRVTHDSIQAYFNEVA